MWVWPEESGEEGDCKRRVGEACRDAAVVVVMKIMWDSVWCVWCRRKVSLTA